MGKVLRALCLLTAVVNCGGNIVMALFYEPILRFLNEPLPADVYTFTAILGFSFTSGVISFLIWRDPPRAQGLLVAGICAKGIFAAITYLFWVFQHIPWIWLVFGGYDAVMTAVWFLYLIQLQRPELCAMNLGEIRAGTGPVHKKALFISYSLTGNGSKALARVRKGLEANGYTVDEKVVVPVEKDLFSFPFSFWRFTRVMFRAIFRTPAKVEPLGLPRDHKYDLFVVEGQTWMTGVSAPIEGVFQHPENQPAFRGRDVAIVNVCRGLWRRSQGMLAAWVDECGGRVVGTSPHMNPGREPMRVFSLFIFLALGKPNAPSWLRGWFLTPQFLSDESLARLETFGDRLAKRGTAPVEAHKLEQVA